VSADEFYIGWQETSPPGFAKRTRLAALVFVAVGLGLGVLLGASQSPLPPALFEFGEVDDFQGTLEAEPYPVLRVRRPGAGAGWSRYLLVAPGKHGADELIAGLDGYEVLLRGTLVHQDGRAMIEVSPDSVEAVSEGQAGPSTVILGERTLVGEIADSKCHLGVMNPGRHKVHRACATLCIRGGIPPILLVDREDGSVERYLLVSPDGKAVNEAVLSMVADTVEITGEVVREDDLLVLRADPASYRRVDP
jgi:hypothetical protein